MLRISFILLIFVQFIFPQDLRERTEEIIKSHFSEDVKLEMVKYSLLPDLKKKIEAEAGQKFFGDFVYIYKIFRSGRMISAAVIDNVYGKAMPITFLVIFDSTGVIKSSEIIKYREQYGGAVQNKKWTAQFKGKDSGSSYKIGEDISSISGATISVYSVTAGIRKAALLFNYIRKKL